MSRVSDYSWLRELDQRYLSADREETLDYYRPRGDALCPAVLYLHGGSFYKGDKASERSISICQDLATAGYAAFSVNYKLSEGTVGDPRWSAWPQNLADCRAAWDYVLDQCIERGIDKNKLYIMGSSAGGTLALLLALSLAPEETMPKGIVNLYGRVDWFRDTVVEKRHSDESVMRAASPIHVLESYKNKLPAILTVHGDADAVVPVTQAKMLDEALQASGHPHELRVLEGQAHSFDLRPEGIDLRPTVLNFLSSL
ncbi:MAG: alpha/beta hydrolase [Planctomycetota bacterium]|nr:alpha/beta hydrolase [Planctomycetota bacterium]